MTPALRRPVRQPTRGQVYFTPDRDDPARRIIVTSVSAATRRALVRNIDTGRRSHVSFKTIASWAWFEYSWLSRIDQEYAYLLMFIDQP